MATNAPGDKLQYWQIALLVWFLTLNAVVIGLSFWALTDIPTSAPATTSRPAPPLPTPPTPPPVAGPDATEAQTRLYQQQVTSYQAVATAYTTALQAARTEVPPKSPRLQAYKEIVVDGLLGIFTAVLTAMFATVVGNKSLEVVEKYLANKKNERKSDPIPSSHLPGE